MHFVCDLSCLKVHLLVCLQPLRPKSSRITPGQTMNIFPYWTFMLCDCCAPARSKSMNIQTKILALYVGVCEREQYISLFLQLLFQPVFLKLFLAHWLHLFTLISTAWCPCCRGRMNHRPSVPPTLPPHTHTHREREKET